MNKLEDVAARPGKRVAPFLLATLMLVLPALAQQEPGNSQQGSSSPSTATANSATPSWTTEQIVTATAHQAWILGGRNKEGFYKIVSALIEISEKNRNITLPESKEAGIAAGNYIRTHALQDPDQLLYAIVDHAVRYTAAKSALAKPTASSTKPATGDAKQK